MADVEENRADEPGWPANLLNENHRRSLATVLRRVELAAWRLEDRLTGKIPPQLALTRFTDPPDLAQRTALLRLVRHVRQEVRKLARDYYLEVTEESFSRSTIAEFTLLWCDLEDSRPQKLRRYGAMQPQANEVLGPSIERLTELMLVINSVASGQQETIRTWQDASEPGTEG